VWKIFKLKQDGVTMEWRRLCNELHSFARYVHLFVWLIWERGGQNIRSLLKVLRMTAWNVASHAFVDACGMADSCDYDLHTEVHSKQPWWCFTLLCINICAVLILSHCDKASVREQRTSVKFCVRLGKTTVETHRMLCEAYSSNVNWTKMFKCHECFQNRRTEAVDKERSGWPSALR
jgi:hypothetical protein